LVANQSKLICVVMYCTSSSDGLMIFRKNFNSTTRKTSDCTTGASTADF
jgi:hypothetical protein